MRAWYMRKGYEREGKSDAYCHAHEKYEKKGTIYWRFLFGPSVIVRLFPRRFFHGPAVINGRARFLRGSFLGHR